MGEKPAKQFMIEFGMLKDLAKDALLGTLLATLLWDHG